MFSRQRMMVGGLTAFAVAFSYVGANAVWYQPYAHPGVFFPTRSQPAAMPTMESGVASQEAAATETIIRIEKEGEESAPEAAAAVPVPGDPTVRTVQRILSDLKLYSGPVDGLTGPQTKAAIGAYQKMVGLEITGGIDGRLLEQLGSSAPAEQVSLPDEAPTPAPTVADIIQKTASAPVPGTDAMPTSSAVQKPDPMVLRIQAGLKAFGNDGIEVDGVVGGKTRAAIREFQSLFGLPETGEPDERLYAKMQEIGLTN